MIIDETDTKDPEAVDEYVDEDCPEENLTSGREPLHAIYNYQETISAKIIDKLMKEAKIGGKYA